MRTLVHTRNTALLLALVFGLWGAPAQAQTQTTLQVDINSCAAEGTQTGTDAYPYCQVQEAIDAAVSSGSSAASPTTIDVAAGEYECFVVHGDGISVQAESGTTLAGDPVVPYLNDDAGTVPACIVIGGSNVQVSGFSIDGLSEDFYQKLDAGIAVLANGVNVDRGDVSYTLQDVVSFVTITGTTVANLETRPELLEDSDGADSPYRGYGLFINGWDGASGEAVDTVENILVDNNTFDSNDRGIGLLGNVPGLDLRYNRIQNNFLDGISTNDSHGMGWYYPLEESLSASPNWWGAVDGPSGGILDCDGVTTADGSGDHIYPGPGDSPPAEEAAGLICFSPWCTNADCTCLSNDTDCDGTPDDEDPCPEDPDDDCEGCTVAVTCESVSGEGSETVTVTETIELTDTDCDGVADGTCEDGECVSGNCNDNCPLIANENQTDSDNDGIGDACDEIEPCTVTVTCESVSGEGSETVTVTDTIELTDTDCDGVADGTCEVGECVSGNCNDNCPLTANENQTDSDNDGIGDACDEIDDDDDDDDDGGVTGGGGGGGAGGGVNEPPLLYVTGYIGFPTDTSERTFTISNDGGGSLEWSIGTVQYTDGSGWITSIVPIEGMDITMVTVQVDRGTLPEGIYEAIIPIESNGGNQNVLVRLGVGAVEVVPAPAILLDPGTLDFGLSGSSLTVTATNEGDEAGTWNVAIAYTDGDGWLSVSDATIEIEVGASAELIVSADRQGLASGTYAAVITCSLAADGSDSQTVEVSMQVGEDGDPVLQTGRTMLYLSRFSDTAEVTLTNVGTGTLTWESDIEYGRRADGWLTVAPVEGAIGEGESQVLSLTVDRDGIAPLFHKATVVLTSNVGVSEITVYIYKPVLGGGS